MTRRNSPLPLWAALAGLTLGSAACEDAGVEVRYAIDRRTGLCFAVPHQVGGPISKVYAQVPCTPEVLTLAGVPK
jgi:hypothetical protein